MIRELTTTEKAMISSQSFKTRMKQPIKIVTNKDVPYLAGFSKNGRTIYIDKDCPRFLNSNGKRVDIYPILILRRRAEKALMDLFRCPFYVAAFIAYWVFEYEALRETNINLELYNNFRFFNEKTFSKSNKLRNLPRDLFLTPYDEKERRKYQCRTSESTLKPIAPSARKSRR